MGYIDTSKPKNIDLVQDTEYILSTSGTSGKSAFLWLMPPTKFSEGFEIDFVALMAGPFGGMFQFNGDAVAELDEVTITASAILDKNTFKSQIPIKPEDTQKVAQLADVAASLQVVATLEATAIELLP